MLRASPTQAAGFLEGVHPADVAEWLQDVDEEDAWQVFAALAAEVQAEVLEFAEETLTDELVGRMSAADLREVVEEMPSDEAVDLLAEADERVAEDVLSGMDAEAAQELRDLAAYDPESAGGIMATEVVTVAEGLRVGDAVKAVRKEGEDAEEETGVFVIDNEGRPVGFLSDRALLTNPIHDRVADVMVAPHTIGAKEDQEEAALRIDKYSLLALGVVDQDGRLIGVISAEDAAEILGDETEEDILRMVGTTPTQQQTRLPILKRVRQRLPLMAFTVMGGLLSARLLSYFAGLSEAGAGDANPIADILRFLPLIIGLAGNVGVQSSTILVRAFATGEVEPDREGQVLVAEVTVGTMIGILCGGMTVLVASWMEFGVLLHTFGAAVGSAVAVAVTCAAVLGCVIPMGCRRLGIDPAIVAGPFLICLSDISGSVIFILVAKALLLP